MNDAWLAHVIQLAQQAGAATLDFFGQSSAILQPARKDDNTLVTQADLRAHEIIRQGLLTLDPTIPLLSEEGHFEAYAVRRQWSRYWLVDPLDGTRGFAEGCKEFTVNIALIENRVPVLGVIYTPVKGSCYYAVRAQGAYRYDRQGEPKRLSTRHFDWQAYQVVLGRYLSQSSVLRIFDSVTAARVQRVSSSLKMCLIAEAKADIYPRLGATGEWDTAAAQCILEEAGGSLVDLDAKPLQYNAKDSLINPPFVALGDPSQAQKIINFIKEKRRML